MSKVMAVNIQNDSKPSMTCVLTEWHGSKIARLVTKLIVIILFLILSDAILAEQTVQKLGFSEINEQGNPKGWVHLPFRKIAKQTKYEVVKLNNKLIIKATADASASALAIKLDKAFIQPVLRWSWKIDNVLPKGDATRKEGDDYPARVYVTFKYDPEKASFTEKITFGAIKALYDEYPPVAALNYIWANKQPKGIAVTSKYTDRAIMIPLQSGNEKAGEWVTEEVNILEDYKKHFPGAMPEIAGIAIMSDADNTGGKATAYFADISVSQDEF